MQDYIIDSVAEAFVELGFETSDVKVIRMMATVLTDLHMVVSDDEIVRLRALQTVVH
jgi:hypothetical protein